MANDASVIRQISQLKHQKLQIEAEIDRLQNSLDDLLFTSAEKLELFKALFFPRADVYARERKNGKGYYPARIHYDFPDAPHKPLSEGELKLHLQGKIRLGTYAMMPGSRCAFLAIDLDDKAYEGSFDRSRALEDALMIIETARRFGVSLYAELSKSGKGVHLWTWFTESVLALNARRLGDLILNEAFPNTSLSLSTFDRFFPTQDFLPEEGLGNLIAVPLHFESAKKNNGTLFFDPVTLEPYANQFSLLARLDKIPTAMLYELTGKEALFSLSRSNNDDLYIPPWERFGKSEKIPLPEEIEVVLDDNLYIKRNQLSKRALFRLQQLVSFPNPDYLMAIRTKRKIVQIPRFLSSFEMDEQHAILPLGVFGQVEELFAKSFCAISVQDKRKAPEINYDFSFKGELSGEQEDAIVSLLENGERGIIEAGTGFGKTVLSIALIARLKLKTLILVNKTDLLKQWRESISHFLDLDMKLIGTYYGARKKLTGEIDIAIPQSIVSTRSTNTKSLSPDEILRNNYGLLIIDECHHAAATSMYQTIKQFNGKRVYGLTATIERSDSKTPFIHYLLGEVAYRHTKANGQIHRLIEVPTHFSGTPDLDFFSKVSELASDDGRNQIIAQTLATHRDRKMLLLSDRVEQIHNISDRLERLGIENLVMHGGLDTKIRAMQMAKLRSTGADCPVVLATSTLLGEGMDLKNIDTFVLGTPVSHPSRLIQMVGRIGRDHERKLLAIDFQDADPLFLKSFRKRRQVYKGLGFLVLG